MSKEQDFTFQHPQSQGTAPTPYVATGTSTEDLQAQIAQLDQQALAPKRINFNTDIIGLFQTVSVAPTQIPISPYQQVQIYVSGTTYRLYWYDNTAGLWHYVTATA